jgi:hypothetical protein
MLSENERPAVGSKTDLVVGPGNLVLLTPHVLEQPYLTVHLGELKQGG